MIHVPFRVLPLGAHRQFITCLYPLVTPAAVVQPASDRIYFRATDGASDVVIFDKIEERELLTIDDHASKGMAVGILTATFDVETFTADSPLGGISRKLMRS